MKDLNKFVMSFIKEHPAMPPVMPMDAFCEAFQMEATEDTYKFYLMYLEARDMLNTILKNPETEEQGLEAIKLINEIIVDLDCLLEMTSKMVRTGEISPIEDKQYAY